MLIGVGSYETPFMFCLVWSVLLYTSMGALWAARESYKSALVHVCMHAFLYLYSIDHIGLAWQLYNGPFSCYVTCIDLRVIDDVCLKF